MRTLSIHYSEIIPVIMNITPESFEDEAKMAMVVKLYEMGRLTSGQAASLAGISRVSFLLHCQRFNSYSVIWDQTEIEEEFRDFGK